MNEFVFNIHAIALIIPMMEILVFAVYRMTVANNYQLSNLLLNAFLLAIVVATMGTIILWNEAFTIDPILAKWLPYFLMCSLVAQGPLLYLYIRSVIVDDFCFKKMHLVHLIPTFICVVIIIAFSLEHQDLQPGSYDQDYLPTLFIVRGLWDIVRYTTLGYAVYCMISLWRLKGVDNFSFPANVDNRWLLFLVGGFLFIVSWSVVIQLSGRYIGGTVADFVGVIHNYLLFMYINVLGAFYLWCYNNQPILEIPQNNQASKIIPFDASEINKVRLAMEEQKYYLEPNISIEIFSSQVGLPVRTVSGIINKHFGQSFFDYLNGYRIKMAKAMLIDSAKGEFTVLDIMYMSGFSSTSSFHRYFKRLEGVTPTEYRRVNTKNNC